MKVAITGASGYVGGKIRDAFQSRNHEVLSWSRRPHPVAWTRYDLMDDPCSLPWDHVDALIHTAYDFDPIDWDKMVESNVKPSIELLRAARTAGVGRLVFISSISSFEGTHSNYGKAKLMIEEAALQLGAVVIRPGLVWGQLSGGVMGALESLVSKFPVIPYLYGSGGLGQYLVHEEDLSHAVVSIAEGLPAGAGSIHEAAHPDPVSILSILKAIAVRSGKSRRFIPIPWHLAMFGLKAAETVGIHPPFRSDSLIGLIHRNPNLLHASPLYGVVYRPFRP